MSGVAILLGQGRALVAGQSVGIAPVGRDGALRLMPDGPVLRPLKFGERARLARAALVSDPPEDELVQSVLAVASDNDAKAHPLAAALALHMAGAGSASVGFAAAQSMLARQLGWSQFDLDAASASDVDALAETWQKSLEIVDNGWTKFVFDGAEEDTEADKDAQALALTLAGDLLSRATVGIDPSALPAVFGPPSHDVQVVTDPNRQTNRLMASATPLPGPEQKGAEASANPTPHPSPRGDQTGDLAASETPVFAPKTNAMKKVSGNPTPLAGPMTGVAATAGDPTPMPGPAATVAANATPHLTPRLSQDSAQMSAIAAHGLMPHDIMAAGVWAKRQPLSAKAYAPSRSTATATTHAPSMSVFGGWFDDAPLPHVTLPGAPTPMPWVWARAEVAQAPVPNLPEAQSTLSVDDATDAIAEALHLMADLRGITP